MSHSDYVDALEAELVAATGCRARLAFAQVPTPPAGTTSIVAVGVLCAAVLGLALQLGSRARPSIQERPATRSSGGAATGSSATSTSAAWRALASQLDPLTPGERRALQSFPNLSLSPNGSGGAINTEMARHAITLPTHEVLLAAPAGTQICLLSLSPIKAGNGVPKRLIGKFALAPVCAPAPEFMREGVGNIEEHAIVGLVPNGVQRVRLVFTRGYTLLVQVHHNAYVANPPAAVTHGGIRTTLLPNSISRNAP